MLKTLDGKPFCMRKRGDVLKQRVCAFLDRLPYGTICKTQELAKKLGYKRVHFYGKDHDQHTYPLTKGTLVWGSKKTIADLKSGRLTFD